MIGCGTTGSDMRNAPLGGAQHPVAFFENGIGDAIMALPALRALSSIFPRRLTLVTNRIAAELCAGELALKACVTFDMRVSDAMPYFNAERIAAVVGRCDLFVCLVPWHSDSLQRLIDFLQPDASVGFFESYTHSCDVSRRKHWAELTFDPIRLIDADYRFDEFCDTPAFLATPPKLPASLRSTPAGHSCMVAAHIETTREKRWSVDNLRTVLDSFLDRRPEFVACVVGQGKQTFRDLRHGDRIIPSFGLNLVDACRIVAHADLFLGVDSCMLHVADFARVPSVGMFGPTNPSEFGFLFAPHRVVAACTMSDVQPAAVEAALDDLLMRSCALRGEGPGRPGMMRTD